MSAPQFFKILKRLASVENKISTAEKPKRTELYNNPDNTSLEITLSESVYNFSFLYVESSVSTYNVIIPIYSDKQSSFRAIGGWSGGSNVGSTHSQGSISNEGKSITFQYFTSIVHNSSGNHTEGKAQNVCKIIGVR